MTVEGLLQILSPLGVAGILAWYLYYNTSVSMPRMWDSYMSKLDELSQKNNHTVEKVCESFEQCIREERNVRREEIRELREMFSLGTCTKDDCQLRRPMK